MVTRKEKKMLFRILTAGVLLVVAAVLPAEGVWKLLLFLVPYGVVGWDVLWKAVRNIAHGQVFDENFLMSLASIGAFFLGEYSEAAAVMLFYQIGELFQTHAVRQSRKSIAALMDIRPDVANVQRNGVFVESDPEQVAVDEIIQVRPGEKVPLDGIILSGESTLDTAALTGESVPRRVQSGDDIISGCVNLSGVLTIRVTKPYGESTVAKILELVENASNKKAKAENFITRFAHYYTPAVVIGAVCLALIPPLFLGNWSSWIHRALIFLVISCPCALVISIPLAFFGGIGGASRRGILVKGGNYLEKLSQVQTIVFDKTGTLTRGEFEVADIRPSEISDSSSILECAALLEQYSSHPIAQSLLRCYGSKPDSTRVSGIKEIAGQGVTALVDGKLCAAGNRHLMEDLGLPVPEEEDAGTMVYVSQEGKYLGSILIADRVKDSAATAIQELKRRNIRTIMLTGDSQRVALAVGRSLELDEVYGDLLPGDKVTELEKILEKKNPKKALAYVGDGVNDAPVLSRADVGVAMGAMGSDAALEAADIVLMDDDLGKLVEAMDLARKCGYIVRENIVFALTVKAVFLLLGALGMASMWEAVFADVGVAILAILNSGRMLLVHDHAEKGQS